MRLILLRHGNTFEKEETSRFIGRRTDLSLTDFGAEQIERAGLYLYERNLIPAVIIHGTLKRHEQSARIIAHACKLPRSAVQSEQNLSEIDYGDWENLTANEIRGGWPAEFAAWTQEGIWPSAVFPQSYTELISQTRELIDGLETLYQTRKVMLITSNGILRTLHHIFIGRIDHLGAKVRTGALCFVKYEKRQSEIIRWDLLPPS